MYNLCLTDDSETCTKEQPRIRKDPLVHPSRWLGQISLPRSQERRDIDWLCGYSPARLGGCLGHVSLLTGYSGPCTVVCVVLISDPFSVFLSF